MNNAAGWKTKTAAICGMVYAVVATLVGVLIEPDPEWALSLSAGATLFLASAGAFGFGDKLRKLIEAIQGKK